MCVIPNNIYVFTNHVGDGALDVPTPRQPLSPYNAEITQILNTGEHRSPLQIFGIVYLAAKSLRSLRIYIALRDRKAVQILYSDITFI